MLKSDIVFGLFVKSMKQTLFVAALPIRQFVTLYESATSAAEPGRYCLGPTTFSV